MKETKLRCIICGEELTPDTARIFDNTIYCEDCLDEATVYCDNCGTLVLRELSRTDSCNDTVLCMDCYNEYYYTCEDCGRIIRQEDAYYLDDYEEYPYCLRCYENKQNHKKIHDYCYRPSPVFYGDSARYFGVELEVDDGGHDDSNASVILDIANNCEDRIYIKSDGSLDDGFEIVTHPMSLEYHINTMPWLEIMDELIDMGYLSHKTLTCGLHCHVNRTAFGETREEQETAIGRVLYFVEHHWDKMLRFSRRTEGQMQRWAARYGIKDKPRELMDGIKKGYHDRYRCINLLNSATIEFRMFRGSLKYNTFIATLQLVNEICNVAVLLSDEEMTELTWRNFVLQIDKKQNPELITYLKERSLFACEEE